MPNVDSKINKVARDAIKAIKPIISKLKKDKGDLPTKLWQDEFFLGFIGFLIERNFRLDVSRSERGFIMAQVFGALANMNGADIARKQTELLSSKPRHAEFEKGAANASICMLASVGELNDRVLPHVEEAMKIAARQGRPDNRNTILEILFENLFYDHLRESFELDIRAEQEGIGHQSEAVDQEEAVVLAMPAFDKSINRGRHEAPRLGGRALRNSSKRDDQSESDQPSKTRGSERSLREAGRANLPGVSEPSDNDEARHHIAELEAQVQELRSRGDNWQKAARAAAAIQARLSTLEGELKQLRSERDSWVSKAQTAQATSDESSQRVVALEADLANLRVERDSWQTAAESARTATTEIRERFAALSADLNKLRDERDASATNADAAQETVADLRQHSATLQADLDQLRGERESLIAQAEAGQRARQERATDARALRREVTLNFVAAIIFCVAVSVLIFFGRLW